MCSSSKVLDLSFELFGDPQFVSFIFIVFKGTFTNYFNKKRVWVGQLTDDNVDNKLRWGGVGWVDQQNGCVNSF